MAQSQDDGTARQTNNAPAAGHGNIAGAIAGGGASRGRVKRSNTGGRYAASPNGEALGGHHGKGPRVLVQRGQMGVGVGYGAKNQGVGVDCMQAAVPPGTRRLVSTATYSQGTSAAVGHMQSPIARTMQRWWLPMHPNHIHSRSNRGECCSYG